MFNSKGISQLRRNLAALFAAAAVLSAAGARGDETALGAADHRPLRIAAIAVRGTDNAERQWTETAAYLARALDRDVRLLPMSIPEIKDAVHKQTIDFALVNPGLYVELSIADHVVALATLVKQVGEDHVGKFGGVIFSKAGRDDLSTISRLKSKRLAAVSENSFGGFQVMLGEFRKHGLELDDSFSEVAFTGFPQDKVVGYVLANGADAGVVRTGILEAMDREGTIKLSDFKIIGEVKHQGFPLRASTDLYPEWAFAKLDHVPAMTAKRALRALLSINAEDAAARNGRYAGWSAPADYQPVHELFQELRIGPYAHQGYSLKTLLVEYHIVLEIVALLLICALGYALYARRQFNRQTARLTEAGAMLELESEQRASAMAKTARLGRILEDSWNEIYIFDAETYRFSYVNQGALKNIGYTLDEMRERTAYDIKPDFTGDAFIGIVQPLFGGTQDFLVFETRHQRKDGSTYPVEVRLQLLAHEDPPVFFAVINDISERKALEQARAEAAAKSTRLGRILEDSWNEIYIFDAETYRFSYVNQGALKNIGYTLDEMRERTAYDIKPDFTGDAFIGIVQPLFGGTQDFLVFETRHQRKDGTTYPVEVRLQLLAHEDPPVFFAVINDISERKAAEQSLRELNATLEKRVEDRTQALSDEIMERKTTEQKLRESEAQTQLIVNSATDAIITINGTGTVQTFNQAAEKIFGFSVVDVVGNNISMLMPPEIAEKHDSYLAPYQDGGAAKVLGTGREITGRRKNGEIFFLELSVSEFTHNGIVHYVGIARDISERKEAQAKLQATLDELRATQGELVQAEKLASLGGLVAGVAHEVNTPVGIGVTASSYLNERTGELSNLYSKGQMKKRDLESYLDVALQSSDIISSNLFRASDLIRSFKQVAVDQSSEEIRQFSVGNYLDEVIISLKPQLKKTKHEIIIAGDRDIKMTNFPGSLAQIVTNLVMNSLIHGYDKGEAGTIEITFKPTPNGIEFTYTDDGKGVAPEHLGKIFDPFFTTKRGSGGSGLGMHILFNLVTQKLGGTVRCRSELGNGIEVTMVIPERIEKGEAA